MINCNKVRPENPAAVNIILEDSEMTEILEELIEKAHSKGFCPSNLYFSLSVLWKEKYPKDTSKPIFELSNEEKELCERAKNFLDYYKQDFFSLYAPNYQDDRKRYLQFYACIASVLITYHNGDVLTKSNVEITLKKYFASFDFTIWHTLLPLGDFLFKCLNYKDDGEMPEVTKSGNLIEFADYTDYKANHISCNSRYYDYAIALVWFINKYF